MYLSETYASFADIYKQKKEPQTALRYYNLLVENDKKSQDITTKIWHKINSEYQTITLEQQIQELINETETKKRKLYFSFIIITLLTLLFLGALFYIRRKKKF